MDVPATLSFILTIAVAALASRPFILLLQADGATKSASGNIQASRWNVETIIRNEDSLATCACTELVMDLGLFLFF